MLKAIIRKEFLEALRDRRFVVLSVIIASLLLISIGVGMQRFSINAAERASAEERTYGQWLRQGTKNPHAAAHYGLYAFKGESPFAYAERGVNDYAGGSIWLEAHRQNLAQNRAAQDGVSIERSGSMTAGFLLQTILPLIIILLAHRVFAGEREAGILAQTLSLNVSPVRLFLGKSVGSGAALMALLAPLIIAGAVVLALGSGPGEQGASRAILFVLLYAGYALLWLMITVAVSAWAKTARTALVTLVALWMTVGFVLPRLAAEGARTAHPPPTFAAFTTNIDHDMREGVNGKENVGAYTKRMTAEALAKYGVASVAQLPVGYQGLLFTWLEKRGGKVFDYHFSRLYDIYFAQERFIQKVALFSPVMAAREVSMAISGSDLATQRAFVNSAEVRRREYIDQINQDMTEHARTGQVGYVADDKLWTSIKPYAFQAPSPFVCLRLQILPIFALMLWLAIGAICGTIAVRRIKPGSL